MAKGKSKATPKKAGLKHDHFVLIVSQNRYLPVGDTNKGAKFTLEYISKFANSNANYVLKTKAECQDLIDKGLIKIDNV